MGVLYWFSLPLCKALDKTEHALPAAWILTKRLSFWLPY
jgi:hypothetical protein